MDILSGAWFVLLALLGFGFVIFIHELGHFVFAKWAKVRVDVFSIGMGPVLWSRQIGETRYALSLLPIGGYVKMLGQEDVPGREADTSDERSFATKHPAWRAAILFGGVLFNLVSSWIILLILGWYGFPMIPPRVGGVAQHVTSGEGELVESAAWQLGLHRGDMIRSINGERVRSYEDIVYGVLGAGTKPLEITVDRDGEEIVLGKDAGIAALYDRDAGRPILGIAQPLGLLISQVAPGLGGSLPEDAPKPAERLVGVGDISFEGLTGQESYDHLAIHLGEEVELVLADGDDTRRARLRYGGSSFETGSSFGLPVRVHDLIADLPAEAAGMKRGDIISAIDGTPVSGSSHLIALVRRSAETGQPCQLSIKRPLPAGGYQDLTLAIATHIDQRSGRPLLGIVPATMTLGQIPVLQPGLDGSGSKPLEAAGMSAGQTLLNLDIPLNKKGRLSKDCSALVVDGGQVIPFDCTEAEWKALSHYIPPGVWAGAFGSKGERGPYLLLRGKRITTVDAQAIIMEDHKGKTDSIDLSDSEPALAQRLSSSLQPGDWILGHHRLPEKGARIDILRGGAAEATLLSGITPADCGTVIGLMTDEKPYQLESWTESFSIANQQTAAIVGVTLSLIPRFFQSSESGGIDASRSLTGPIGIFTILKLRLQHLGFPSFLKILALIGINLFLINLLPIPIVDGGQLLFLGIEVVIRRPVPERVVLILNYLGLALIVYLMIYVIGLDLIRTFFS